MKAFENIDEILKKGMENYQPTPPADVWAHLEQNLVQAPVGSTHGNIGNAGKIVNAIKSAGIVTKVALLAIVPSLLGVYFLLQSESAINKSIVAPVNQVLEPAKSIELTENKPVLAEPTLKENSPIKKPTGAVIQPVHSGKTKLESSPILPLIENKSNIQNPESGQKTQQPDNLNNTAAAGTSIQTKAEPKTKVIDDVLPVPAPKIEDNPKSESNIPDLIANVFTPNGDGINDKFVLEIENPVYYHLIIYDGRGKVVFESTQAHICWNGTDMKTGMDCEEGYYTYSFDYQLSNSKQIQNKKDIIMLRR